MNAPRWAAMNSWNLWPEMWVKTSIKVAVAIIGLPVAHVENNLNRPAFVLQTVNRNPKNIPITRVAVTNDRRLIVVRTTEAVLMSRYPSRTRITLISRPAWTTIPIGWPTGLSITMMMWSGTSPRRRSESRSSSSRKCLTGLSDYYFELHSCLSKGLQH